MASKAPTKPWVADDDATWRVSVRKARETGTESGGTILTFFKAVAIAGKAIKNQPKKVRKAIGKHPLAVKYWDRDAAQRPWKLLEWELDIRDLTLPVPGEEEEEFVLAAPAAKKKKPTMIVKIRAASRYGTGLVVAEAAIFKFRPSKGGNRVSKGNSAKAVHNLTELIRIWKKDSKQVKFKAFTLARAFEFRATPLAWDVVRSVTLDRMFTGLDADTPTCRVCASVAGYTCAKCGTGDYCGQACQAVAFHTGEYCC